MDKFEKYLANMVNNIQKTDGKIIGKDMFSSRMRLSKDDKGAYIVRAADQYLKKEDMEEIPKEINISGEDVISELVKREIEKIIGAD